MVNKARKKAIIGLRTVAIIALTTFLTIFVVLSNYNINEQHRTIKTRIEAMNKDLARIRRQQDEMFESLGISSSTYIEPNE